MVSINEVISGQSNKRGDTGTFFEENKITYVLYYMIYITVPFFNLSNG